MNMSKAFALLAFCAALSAFGQGTVDFRTRILHVGVNTVAIYGGSMVAGTPTPVPVGAKPDADVNIESGGYNWGGIYARAGLYGGPNGTARNDLTLLTPVVGFKTGQWAGYVESASEISRTVPGVPGGEMATVQVRMWDCGVAGIETYEDALALSAIRDVYLGESSLLNNLVLGNYIAPDGTPPTVPAFLTGLNNNDPIFLRMTVVDQNAPEPSVIALGILGGVAGLLMFRRRI